LKKIVSAMPVIIADLVRFYSILKIIQRKNAIFENEITFAGLGLYPEPACCCGGRKAGEISSAGSTLQIQKLVRAKGWYRAVP
jgi:hypothetical protein